MKCHDRGYAPRVDGQRALHSPTISFEFFPPKTEEMERSLWETINRLAPLTPNFVSVTYGAGGSTRERTHSTIARILKETQPDAGRASDLRRRAAGEIDDVVGALSRDRRPPHRRAARRSDHRHRHRLSCPSRRLSELARPDRRHQEALSRYRNLGLGLSREAPREPRPRCRYRHAQGQGRCRRGARHHPGVLR